MKYRCDVYVQTQKENWILHSKLSLIQVLLSKKYQILPKIDFTKDFTKGLYYNHSLWKMILPAQVYNKFNFRPNILRFHKRKQMAEAKAGFPRRGGEAERGQMPQLEPLSLHGSWHGGHGRWPLGISNPTSQRFIFLLKQFLAAFDLLNWKKKSKKSVSLEY